MTVNEYHTAQEATIKVPEGEEITVSNVSWSKDTNETEVQHNDGLWAERVTTGLRVSGSFEYSGADDEIRRNLYWGTSANPIDEANRPVQEGEPRHVTMSIKEDNPEADGVSSRTTTFTKVKVTGMSRDLPSDDVSSTSWDFVAKEVNTTTTE